MSEGRAEKDVARDCEVRGEKVDVVKKKFREERESWRWLMPAGEMLRGVSEGRTEKDVAGDCEMKENTEGDKKQGGK